MSAILQKEATILRKIARDIPPEDIPSLKIKRLIKQMQKAIASREDAVAIAAPQVGASLRMFIVSGKIFNGDETKTAPRDLVCINPRISKLSRTKREMDEGCLSVDGWYGKTKRSTKATITAYDETGKKFTRGASGLLAQIFQHEMNHLEGILFTDHATDLVRLPADSKRQAAFKKRIKAETKNA